MFFPISNSLGPICALKFCAYYQQTKLVVKTENFTGSSESVLTYKPQTPWKAAASSFAFHESARTTSIPCLFNSPALLELGSRVKPRTLKAEFAWRERATDPPKWPNFILKIPSSVIFLDMVVRATRRFVESRVSYLPVLPTTAMILGLLIFEGLKMGYNAGSESVGG